MTTDTCARCERIFANAMIETSEECLESYLDETLMDMSIDTSICIKCFARIVTRYDN